MTNTLNFIQSTFDNIVYFIQNTAFAVVMSVPFLVFAAVCAVIAFVLWVRDSSAERRATRRHNLAMAVEARKAERARSMAAHPAGRANQPRVLEATRHIDRPGYDWTSGIVPD